MKEEYINEDSIRVAVFYAGSLGLHDEAHGIGQQLVARLYYPKEAA